MTVVETRYEHIVLRDGQVPEIAGTTMKVIELVMAQQAEGWGPAELAFQFPYLTLSQIHSALAYYWDHQWDHQAEMDEDIARDVELVEELRKNTPEPPIVERLRAIKYG